MNLRNVEKALTEISRSLEKINGRREKLLKESRDIISLSAKAIINLHTGKIEDAKKNLNSIKIILSNLQRTGQEDLARYLIPPEGEYVEAAVLYAIATRKPLPSRRMLNVSNQAYLFGFLDAIGEIKRLVYDRMRNGRYSEASNLFDMMEKLYVLLSPLAAYDNVASGFRRKLDIARRLIEDTRGIITEEIRRQDYLKNIEKLSDRLREEK